MGDVGAFEVIIVRPVNDGVVENELRDGAMCDGGGSTSIVLYVVIKRSR